MGDLLQMMGHLSIPVNEEFLRPEDFVKMTDRQLENVRETRFIPPKLGGSHFGRIQVFYKIPVLREAK